MKMFILLGLLFLTRITLADCLEDCKTNYVKCKAVVEATGGLSYFKCIAEKEACANACPKASS